MPSETYKAIQLNPNYAQAYNSRGVVYCDKGEVDRAIADFNRRYNSIQIMPMPITIAGVAYEIKEEYDRAIENYTKAIQLNPNYADAYYNRGVAYEVKGEVDCAVEDYNKAIQLNPSYADAYKNRGEAWLHLGARKKTRLDRTAARNMETNMSASFENVLAANPPEQISPVSISPQA